MANPARSVRLTVRAGGGASGPDPHLVVYDTRERIFAYSAKTKSVRDDLSNHALVRKENLCGMLCFKKFCGGYAYW